MKWNNLKNWQKGGIIGVLLAILIIIKVFNCSDTPFCWYLGYFTVPSLFIADLFPYDIQSFAFSILLLIQYFIIGALIGLIVDKVKNKKDPFALKPEQIGKEWKSTPSKSSSQEVEQETPVRKKAKRNVWNCEYCNAKIKDVLDKYHCKYCDKYHCPKHRLPEKHKCPNPKNPFMDKYRR